MRLTNLPYKINPDTIVENTVIRIYGSKCPFCDAKKDNIKLFRYDTYRGYQCGEGFTSLSCLSEYKSMPIWERYKYYVKRHKRRTWKNIDFKCRNCGAGWESPYFPQDIINYKELEEFHSGILSQFTTKELMNEIERRGYKITTVGKDISEYIVNNYIPKCFTMPIASDNIKTEISNCQPPIIFPI